MRIRLVCLFVVAILAGVRPASAQLLQQPGGASFASTVGIHAFGIFEGETMLAKKSFDAILSGSNKTQLTFTGGGVEVTRLWKGAFVRFAGTKSTNSGNRVFLDASNTPHNLNVPVTIEITPIEIGGGWRFGGNPRRPRKVTIVPYAGAAYLSQHYKETSDGAAASENTDVTDRGRTYFGGVELGVSYVKVGLEFQYRDVPYVPGADSVAQAFKEDNLGGTVFRFTIGVGF